MPNKPTKKTKELMDYLLEESYVFTQENIKGHYLCYPGWKETYARAFPGETDMSVEKNRVNYIPNAIALLERNGNTMEVLRFTESKKSAFSMLFSIELYIKGVWKWESETKHVYNLLSSWLCDTLAELEEEHIKKMK